MLEPLHRLRWISGEAAALVERNGVGEHGLDVAAPRRRFVQLSSFGVVAARAPAQFVGQAELVLDPRDVLALGPRDEEPFEAFHVFRVRRPQRRAAGGAGAPAALFQVAVGVRGACSTGELRFALACVSN